MLDRTSVFIDQAPGNEVWETSQNQGFVVLNVERDGDDTGHIYVVPKCGSDVDATGHLQALAVV